MPQDEQVDIVNDLDKVIGNASKREAHEKGLLHRTVIAEVIGSDGLWTLVCQSSDRQDAGQYVSPIGGHVQAGESEDEALLREANEEYGLPDTVTYRLVGKKIFNRIVNNRIENHYFILYEIHTDLPPCLNEESVGYARFSKEQLKQELAENPKKFGDALFFVLRSFYPDIIG